MSRITFVLAASLALAVGPSWAVCLDSDGDGFGVNGDPSCPGGTAPDCDDTNGAVYPEAPEVCDGVNNDCDHPWWPLLMGWVARPISTNADGARSVFAADVDGDSDLDVLSASQYDSEIAWHENLVGGGSTWTEHLISDSVNSARSVFAADVDGDNDIDALSVQHSNGRNIWHENTAGDGSAWTYHLISITDGATSVFAADVDGDSDLDVLSGADEWVAWHENTAGDGSAWTFRLISVTNEATSVFAADVDGDDDLDAVSASHLDDKIAWHENTAGDGSAWTERVISTVAEGAESVFAADVDGDNDLDVLSASADDDKIAWYENLTGDGSTWTEHVISTSAWAASSVFAADVDGDSDMDVLSASRWDDKIAWYENTAGDGSAWTEHVITLDADGARSVFAADVDGDSDLDVLSASSGDDKIAWYESTSLEVDDDGDGLADCEGDCDDENPNCVTDCTDADADGYCVTHDCDDSKPFCTTDCTDLDGDGYCATHDCDDTVAECTTDCADADGDGLAECAGDCDDGNPHCTTDCTDMDADGYCVTHDCDDSKPFCTTDCTDLDGDGYCVGVDCDDSVSTCTDDCVTDLDSDGTVDCADTCIDVDGDGHGTAGGAGDTCVAEDCDDTNPNCTTDCTDGDGDGYCVTHDCDDTIPSCTTDCVTNEDNDPFIACLDCDDANAAVYPGAPEVCDGFNNDCDHPWWPSLDGWTESTLFNFAGGAWSVFGADVDGDSDEDVLSAWSTSDKIQWFENTSGDGSTWTRRPISLTVDGARSVYGADMDGDGDLDVLSASSDDNKVAWHENTAAPGLWPERVITTSATDAWSVFGADVDGDGDPDALVALYDGSRVLWYENVAGDGSVWTEHVVSSWVEHATSIFAADVDGDGDLDVLSASFGAGIAWHENLSGDGTIWATHEMSTTSQGHSVFAADMDGDGDMDALSALGNQVAWHENTSGNGSSWVEHTVLFGDSYYSVFAADLDDDADLDIVSASSEITWHENLQGDGLAWTERTVSTKSGARSVFAVDIDGDTDVDVLSAHYADSDIAWHENDSVEPDVDGDGLKECEGDCDDTLPYCTTDCTDLDGDGYCVTHDCDDSKPNCTTDCRDVDGDGYCVTHDCDDTEPSCTGLDCSDVDGDGVRVCEGDCNDTLPNCTTDCTDLDGDGYCVTTDCDETLPNCTTDCTDVDVDGYCVTHDCDDTVAECTTDCTDADEDGLAVCAGDCDDGNPFCTTDCTDVDGDGYCVTHDCDDTQPTCTGLDCSDADGDGVRVCEGDCDDSKPNCTTDCTDADDDDWCVTHDCDDTIAGCTDDCTDADEDGLALCAGDCDDGNPYCTTDCTDADDDDYCVTTDCDDTTPDCTDDCTDADGDGLRACDGDCDDGNPNCTTDCTDLDGDGYCLTADCDESNPYCTEDCTDADGDGYCVDFDCDDFNPDCVGLDCTDSDGDGFAGCEGDCDDTNAAIYPGQLEVCTDTLDNDCDGFIDASDGRCSDLVATSLSFESRDALSWTPGSSADSYGLYRGTISAAGWSGYDHLCEATELADTAAVDPDVPALGEGFYYLANGQNLDIPGDDFVNGPLGTGSGTISRPDSDTIPCGPRVYVDPDVIDGDGLSWATAYSSVGTALTHGSFTDRGLEIWAQGEAAERNSNPQAQRPGIRILGGFAGTETASWERSPETTPTIWDGGLAGGNPLIRTAGTSVVLDGLTMQSAVSALVGEPAGRLIELTDVKLEQMTDYAVDLVFEQGGESKLVVRDVTFDSGGLGGLRAIAEAGVLRGQIRDSVFLGSSDAALRLEARSAMSAEVGLDVVGNTISGGGTGIVLGAHLNDGEATVVQSSFLGSNVIHGTAGSLVVVEAGGHFVFATGPALAEARPVLTGNTLSDGGAAGVQCTVTRTGVQANHEIRCVPELWDNLITFNADAGIAESADDPATGLVSDPVVVGNGLFGNLAAYLDEGSQYLMVGELNGLAEASDNFTGDPLYEDRAMRDYHLQPGTVLGFGSSAHYLANQSDPGLSLSWTEPLFDATDWSTGAYGIGYELEPFPGASRLLLTVVPAGTSSVYTRLTFEVQDASEIYRLILGVDYDDGYVVWLNGAEVRRSPSMPGGAPAWNTTPSAHESSNHALPNFQQVNITAAGLPVLVTGTNVLAVGVWNESAGSPDLVLVPRLTLNEDSPAIDTGHLEAPRMAGEDMDAEVRVTDGNRDGVTRPDAGADER